MNLRQFPAVRSLALKMALDALIVEVELSISAANLEDRDATSKSDPMCVVYLKVNSTFYTSSRVAIRRYATWLMMKKNKSFTLNCTYVFTLNEMRN